MEYCGEVMGYEEFEKRVETYDKENRQHYYFMTLKADEVGSYHNTYHITYQILTILTIYLPYLFQSLKDNRCNLQRESVTFH